MENRAECAMVLLLRGGNRADIPQPDGRMTPRDFNRSSRCERVYRIKERTGLGGFSFCEVAYQIRLVHAVLFQECTVIHTRSCRGRSNLSTWYVLNEPTISLEYYVCDCLSYENVG